MSSDKKAPSENIVWKFMPIFSALIIVFGGWFVAIKVTTEWQQRVTEKQIEAQSVSAEWNQEWNSRRNSTYSLSDPEPLREKLMKAGVLTRKLPTDANPR